MNSFFGHFLLHHIIYLLMKLTTCPPCLRKVLLLAKRLVLVFLLWQELATLFLSIPPQQIVPLRYRRIDKYASLKQHFDKHSIPVSQSNLSFPWVVALQIERRFTSRNRFLAQICLKRRRNATPAKIRTLVSNRQRSQGLSIGCILSRL